MSHKFFINFSCSFLVKNYRLLNFSCASPTPQGVIYGNFPHRVAHPKKFMNIFGSLMAIFDQKKFMNIFGSLMAIFDPKNKYIP